MYKMTIQSSKRKWLEPHSYLSLQVWETLGTWLFNLFILGILFVYLFPILYMVATAFMDDPQLRDRNAPPIHPSTYGLNMKGRNIPSSMCRSTENYVNWRLWLQDAQPASL